MDNPLRRIPSVHQLLETAPIKRAIETANHSAVVAGIRSTLSQLRDQVQHATGDVHIPTSQELAQRIADWIRREEKPRLRPVINATGVLLHTGLGRAPLAREAIDAIEYVAQGYASVETDLATGQRSQRIKSVERILCQLTESEAAAVVNNNAAATILALSAVAHGRDVIVSRGQLVEIGGSYRLPEVMHVSGARLVEVGTTNKTRPQDYEQAITESTGAIMRVHPSNFRLVGFTSGVELKELVELGRQHHLPVIDDIGSGALIDMEKFDLAGEPMALESIRAGVDLALFSGDKLLGGPQCGIIVGKHSLVEQIVQHPMARAMRVDKLTLAALYATLQLYRDPKLAAQRIPLLAMLATPLQNLRLRGERLVPQIAALAAIQQVELVETQATIGGGSLPGQGIPSIALALQPQSLSVDALATKLRTSPAAIVGRIEDDRLLLDLRTVFPSEDLRIVDALQQLQPTHPSEQNNAEEQPDAPTEA